MDQFNAALNNLEFALHNQTETEMESTQGEDSFTSNFVGNLGEVDHDAKIVKVDSLHHAAENLASDNSQPGIQVVQQPDGRFFIRDYDLQKIVKRLQPYYQFANYGSQEYVVRQGDGIHRGNKGSVSTVPIPDEQLRTMTVVELNKAVREADYDRTTTLEIKQRRRTLLNRGYAANCREKRMKKADQLIAKLKLISGKD